MGKFLVLVCFIHDWNKHEYSNIYNFMNRLFAQYVPNIRGVSELVPYLNQLLSNQMDF